MAHDHFIDHRWIHSGAVHCFPHYYGAELRRLER
jgi:hypothetical protein